MMVSVVANRDPERESLLDHARETTVPKDLPDVIIGRRDVISLSAKQTTWQTLFTRILKFVRYFQRDDSENPTPLSYLIANVIPVRFALKVGTGASLWAMFAFIPETRPYYTHWRGEWGLLSFMLVCSMTIGASNTTGYARFIGTLMGAVLSIVVWLSCNGNPFALAFCGWLVSFGCFYLIVGTSKGPLGRFLLLTVYKFITCLLCFG
jgi:hypothetical protein